MWDLQTHPKLMQPGGKSVANMRIFLDSSSAAQPETTGCWLWPKWFVVLSMKMFADHQCDRVIPATVTCLMALVLWCHSGLIVFSSQCFTCGCALVHCCEIIAVDRLPLLPSCAVCVRNLSKKMPMTMWSAGGSRGKDCCLTDWIVAWSRAF